MFSLAAVINSNGFNLHRKNKQLSYHPLKHVFIFLGTPFICIYVDIVCVCVLILAAHCNHHGFTFVPLYSFFYPAESLECPFSDIGGLLI